MAPARSVEPVTVLVNAVLVANGVLLAAGDDLTASVGLSAAKWRIVGALEDEPATVATIARRRALARQSVRETMARLAHDGFVVPRADPADARAPIWSLTPKARAALRAIEQDRRKWERAVASSLDAEQVEQAIRLLTSLVQVVDVERS